MLSSFTRSSLSYARILMMLVVIRPCAMGGGNFGNVPIQITDFAPQARNVPPKQGFALKESNRSGATGVCFGACAPPKYCLSPPSVRKVRSKTKTTNDRTPRRSLRFRAKHFFMVFTPKFWARIEIRTIRFRRAPLDYESAPPSKNCVLKGGNDRYARSVIGDEDLLFLFCLGLYSRI